MNSAPADPGHREQLFLLEPEWPLPAGVRCAITLRSAWPSPQSRLQQVQIAGAELECPAGRDTGSTTVSFAASETDGFKQSPRLRAALAGQLGCDITVQWLNQVHGANVVEARADKQMPNADACYSRTKNLACAVMTADCLPLLITALDGSVVATAHGGWRGLAAGVITATVERLGLHPSQLSVYLGPAICAAHFEVGPEVRSVFLAKPWLKALERARGLGSVFRPSPARAGRYHADLYELARLELRELGVSRIHGGGLCSYGQPQWFYSHRRGRDVGRTASLIWME